MMLECKDLICGYHKTPVLHRVSFSVQSGEVLCVLGANGQGKTTLFKTLLKLLPPMGGKIEIDGEDIFKWGNKKMARCVGYIPQATTPPFSYTVRNMVMMGRTAHLRTLSNPNEKDMEIVLNVIEQLGIEKLADKAFLSLSGGEKQLVVIARALAQEPRIMVMDEPTNALDFANQQMVLRQVKQLRKRNLAVIMASHFPDHAFSCADRVLMLKDGETFLQGNCTQVITEESLEHLYGIKTKIVSAGVRAASSGGELKVCVAVDGEG